MGMDVYGTNPTCEAGEYFRANVWWWHPLWEYCETRHADIAGKVKSAHYNDGDGLGAEDSEELAKRLLADIESGAAAAYEKSRNEFIASLPRRECKWCEGTGIRTDAVGVENGMPNRKLELEESIVLGRERGWCNGCHGYGSTAAPEADYSFTAEMLGEFAVFLENCGGFSIC